MRRRDAMLQVFFDASYWDTTQSVLEPECGGSIDTLNFTFSGWGYWENRFPEPCVCRWHWLENKRMTHVCDRCAPWPQLLQCEVGCCAAAMRVTRVAGGLRTKLRMCKARCSTA